MSSWKGKTRGGLLGYKIFTFLIRSFGLSAAYFVLKFVAFYFVLFAPTATKSIYYLYRHRLNYGTWKSAISVYQNFVLFGKTIIDKVAVGSGQRDKFTYSFDGENHLTEISKTGGIIFSAHLGNWEIAGLFLDQRVSKTNILMYAEEHEKIKAHLDRIQSENKVNVIPMKNDFSHIFKLKAALRNKELVCVHGDRFLEGSRVIRVPFLGKEASFPLGPFLLASKLNVPIAITFAIRDQKTRAYYLSSTPNLMEGQPPETILKHYVEILEKKLMENPLQWFNYYDFWSEELRGASTSS
jgi:predicted LPLAT superfamily acyltransferase